jgi:UDP-N-acetylmuramoyl-tripeptide--D-alanyl-D-alanine ligase
MRKSGRRFELWFRQVVLGRLFRMCRPLLFLLARLWRRLLVRTTFIAVTGSLGKTTTTKLLAGILATRGRTFHTIGNQNSGFMVPLNILRVRPWHRYAVLEVGIGKPGVMRKLARTLRPDVAVVLGVFPTHTTSFASLDQHADEKALLLASLAPDGIAVLNGDDARVARMAGRIRHRACFFGTSDQFDFWADGASGRWPDRLNFHVHTENQSREIQTRLFGTHWISALTGVLAAAVRLGVSLEDAGVALQGIEPHAGRMDAISLPNGVVVVRDDYNASVNALEASLEFLREARGVRRVLVVTDFSDSGVNRRHRLQWLAAAVANWLDVLVLVGGEHEYGGRRATESGMAQEKFHGFQSLREAAGFLKTELRSGDLVLLKGRTTDHAARLFFAQCGTLECWRDYCRKTMLCDTCWELGFRPSGDFTPPSLGARV